MQSPYIAAYTPLILMYVYMAGQNAIPPQCVITFDIKESGDVRPTFSACHHMVSHLENRCIVVVAVVQVYLSSLDLR